MGLDTLQSNFREWVVRAFKDRFYLLGKIPFSKEPHVPGKWPAALALQKIETAERIYELYNPTLSEASCERTLETETRIAGLADRVVRYYPRQGWRGYDSTALVFDAPDIEDRSGKEVGRLYIHFDHARLEHSKRLAGFLQRTLAFRTSGICYFKIAGPKLDLERKDSAVLYLNPRGVADRERTAAVVSDLIPLSDGIPYGLQEIRPGIGFCHNPERIANTDWKREYHRSERTSFGLFLSAYLARALREGPPNVEAFADRLAELFGNDGIDPMHLYLLSDSTRADAVPKHAPV